MTILDVIGAERRHVCDALETLIEQVRRELAPDPLAELTAEFPDYEFSRRPHWDGVAIHAVARDKADGPPIYAVSRRTPDEIRKALRGQP